ncbi:MAG: TlyA family rRNA (cytidine-2'-O)-methyltransferase [Candidatus Hydrogenedentota bacterium]
MKERLDVIVQARLGVSRAKAQAIIQSGHVLDADGRRLDKAGLRVDDGIELRIVAEPNYVSRGGDKLEGALTAFALNVEGRVAIDVGASTGGFTDCLLHHGAARVYSVDVGYGQLAWKLRQDPRVVVMERTNIRQLKPEALSEKPTFFVADCSFISLRLVLPPLKALIAPGAEGVVLIKPQFEAGKADVGKGGVVRDPEVHQRVIEEVLEAAGKLGFEKRGVVESPLVGPAGNVEFLAYLGLDSCMYGH